MGLASKFAALLHALRMEAPGWDVVSMVTRSTIALTTDYGTEASLGTAEYNCNDIYPHWDERGSIVDDVADTEFFNESVASFRHAMSLPGPSGEAEESQETVRDCKKTHKTEHNLHPGAATSAVHTSNTEA
eukprot:6480834-Amphidinium_carterae.1